MRTYVDFDGKNAVPEWVEDCFDCVRSEDGKSWAFFYGETLWEAETDARATVFRNRNTLTRARPSRGSSVSFASSRSPRWKSCGWNSISWMWIR